jgi:hypothetical protein
MSGEDKGLSTESIVDEADKETSSPERTEAERDQGATEESEAPIERHWTAGQGGDAPTVGVPDMEPLLPEVDVKTLGVRWESIQTGFVDEPRQSVENADQLVTEAMKGLAAIFSEARADLERQWEQGGDVSTEDLRIILQRYRSFFQRLLAA